MRWLVVLLVLIFPGSGLAETWRDLAVAPEHNFHTPRSLFHR